MLKHEFSLREKVLIIVLALLALSIFVYEVVFVSIDRQIASYNTADLEDQITIEQTKAQRISVMKRTIEENQNRKVGELSVYNNLTNEITAMSTIFNEHCDNVSLSWSDPVLDGTIVRRDVAISFTTASYDDFRTLLKELSECQYRCLIKNVNVSGYNSSTNTGIRNYDNLSVSVNVTFYETTEGATSLSGLVVPADNSSDQEGELEQRAGAYDGTYYRDGN